MVAENDLALGRMVEAITQEPLLEGVGHLRRSRTTRRTAPTTWTRTARWPSSSAPTSRRGAVDSTLYTTSGMLRTIELILGLPPMSQYDAAATPMYGAFQATPVLDAVHAAARRGCRSTRRTPPTRGAPGLDGHEPRGSRPRPSLSSTRSSGSRCAAPLANAAAGPRRVRPRHRRETTTTSAEVRRQPTPRKSASEADCHERSGR